jgi:hypothetical protein
MPDWLWYLKFESIEEWWATFVLYYCLTLLCCLITQHFHYLNNFNTELHTFLFFRSYQGRRSSSFKVITTEFTFPNRNYFSWMKNILFNTTSIIYEYNSCRIHTKDGYSSYIWNKTIKKSTFLDPKALFFIMLQKQNANSLRSNEIPLNKIL